MDRCLWMMPLDGELLLNRNSCWNRDLFTTLVSQMEGDDAFITSLPLSVEEIKALKNEEHLLFSSDGLTNHVGSIVIHGHYDYTIDATVQTMIPCNEQLNTVVHILSLDFFKSLKQLNIDNDPWDAALRLLVGTHEPIKVEQLDRTAVHYFSTKFEMVTWIGYDHRIRPKRALGYWTYATNKE